MSVRIMAAVWEAGPRSPEDLLALLAIADHANDEGVAYPGIARLAEKCRVTERTLQRTLRRLEAGGWLETTIGGGRAHTNLYRVIVKGDVDAPVSAGNPDVGDGNPDVGDMETPTPTSPEPSVEPSLQTSSPPAAAEGATLTLIPEPPAGPDQFDAWWALYPKKVGKGAARKAWPAAVKKVGARHLVAALTAQLPVLKAREARYVPHPSTWLNEERWSDDLATLRQADRPAKPQAEVEDWSWAR